MISPIPCCQCGNLYMRKDLTLDVPRLCNNCEYAELKKQATKLKPVKNSKEGCVTIEIECDHQMAAEIEEYCMNYGISFSEYFIKVHKFCGRIAQNIAPHQFSEANREGIESNVIHSSSIADTNKRLLEEFKTMEKETLRSLVEKPEGDKMFFDPKSAENPQKTNKKKAKK
jgi:hypothetical protein